MQGGACGSAKRFGSERICGAALSGGDCRGCGGAEGGGGADDCAYVAGILYASENYDEGRGVVSGGTGNVVEGECAGSDQCGDALGMFGVGDGFEEAVGGEQDGDGDFRTVEILSKARAVAFAGFAEENGSNRRGRAESFFDEAGTFYADGAGFGWQAAAEGDAEFLEPTIVSGGDNAGLRRRA